LDPPSASGNEKLRKGIRVKKLLRLLIVAVVAGAVATVIVQRDRLRQLDREQLAAQVREGIQSLRKRGEEATRATAETVEEKADAAEDQVAEAVEATAEKAAEAIEEGSETTTD
jgi:hypothetical protein